MSRYKDHMDQVSRRALRSTYDLLSIATLALLSIRQQWHTIGNQMDDVREHGVDSKYLFGSKRTGYKYLVKNIDWLYAVTKTAESDYELLDAWSTVPGLGLVKVGFVIQMARGVGGCIDMHNMLEYGIPAAQLRFSKDLSTKAKAVKLRGYLALCNELGGSEYLWEQWCHIIAAKRPAHFASAVAVSRSHLQYLDIPITLKHEEA